MKHFDRILKDALIKNNILTEGDIEAHLSDARAVGISFRDFLLKRNIVNERQILVALSQHLDLEMIDFKTATVDPAAIERVPIKFAWYYKFIPVKIEGDVLTFASSLPLDVKIQDEIRMHLGMAVKPALATEADLSEAMKKYYGFASETIDRIMTKEPGKKEVVSSADRGQGIEDLESASEDPTVSNLVNQIILEAYKKRATDIHLEPYRNRVRFRYRIDGILVDANLSQDVKPYLPQILSRIKILANLSITEKRLPQDGSAVVKTKEQNLDLRVSTMPTPWGESMVIRILPTKIMLFSLEKLGFNQGSVKVFKELLEKPHGIIFITGPTGSGKTTTLYACLNEINKTERKIITIEDPVEYEMEGITQVQVNTKANFDFSTGLRSILRHDPDILMVGEVRDPETAEIAIKTALTGHLVFSTLHTNDAPSGITRLIDMGVEPYLVASSVVAFVAQRLVRVICPHCKELVSNPVTGIREEIARSLKLSSLGEIKIYQGKGCEFCNETGFYGRVVISEILVLNDTIRSAILEKPRSDYIKKIAMKQGMLTLRQNGWKAVCDGITTPQEIMNVTIKDDYLDSPSISPVTALPKIDLKETSVDWNTVAPKSSEGLPTINDYDSRAYSRSLEPVEIQYRLVRRDPNDSQALIYEGTDRLAVTQDISAGGLRFVSKQLFSIGSILELKIYLPEGKVVECLTKVCRVEEDTLENIYTIITYYLDISSADRVSINKFIEIKRQQEKVPLQPRE